ncbi:unnamed protein product [Closterium sp. Naga37s-1]|nr:unnamed protein product [Closterium sp. Naga37s-1]
MFSAIPSTPLPRSPSHIPHPPSTFPPVSPLSILLAQPSSFVVPSYLFYPPCHPPCHPPCITAGCADSRGGSGVPIDTTHTPLPPHPSPTSASSPRPFSALPPFHPLCITGRLLELILEAAQMFSMTLSLHSFPASSRAHLFHPPSPPASPQVAGADSLGGSDVLHDSHMHLCLIPLPFPPHPARLQAAGADTRGGSDVLHDSVPVLLRCQEGTG